MTARAQRDNDLRITVAQLSGKAPQGVQPLITERWCRAFVREATAILGEFGRAVEKYNHQLQYQCPGVGQRHGDACKDRPDAPLRNARCRLFS